MPEQMTLEETSQILQPRPVKKKDLWRVTKSPSRLLDKLLTRTGSRIRRSKILLTHPDSDGDNRWYMYVPKSFNSVLDIRQTERMINGKQKLVWTQGISFSFQTGDTIYDTPKAYFSPWCEAIKYIELCVQIEKATPAFLNFEEKRFSPGFVRFSLLTPDKLHYRLQKIHTLEMTQGEFVQFLIDGPSVDIQSFVDLPDPTGKTERTNIRFTVKEDENNEAWIMLEPMGQGSYLFENGVIGFNLISGTTLEQAQALCQSFESQIESLTFTRFNDGKSMNRDKWEFYQDKRCEWRWRRLALNGRIVGASSEGYKTRESCVGNAQRNGYKDCRK